MNVKHQKYIEYIAKDIELPYLKYLNMYGLNKDEMNMVLGIVFNQPVFYIKPMHGVYNKDKNKIYSENSDGDWYKYEYDTNGNKIYVENSDGNWIKIEYDTNNYETYREYSDGFWVKWEYDENGNETYYENSNGEIEDNR